MPPVWSEEAIAASQAVLCTRSRTDTVLIGVVVTRVVVVVEMMIGVMVARVVEFMIGVVVTRVVVVGPIEGGRGGEGGRRTGKERREPGRGV